MLCDYQGCSNAEAPAPPGGDNVALCDAHAAEFARAAAEGPGPALAFWVRAHGGSGLLSDEFFGRLAAEELKGWEEPEP